MKEYFIVLLVVGVGVWKYVWYGAAIYKSFKEERIALFIILFATMFMLNDLGIIPITYILFSMRRKSIKQK